MSHFGGGCRNKMAKKRCEKLELGVFPSYICNVKNDKKSININNSINFNNSDYEYK